MIGVEVTDRLDGIKPSELVVGDVVADLQQVEFDRNVLVQAANWRLSSRLPSKLVQQIISRANGFATRPPKLTDPSRDAADRCDNRVRTDRRRVSADVLDQTTVRGAE